MTSKVHQDFRITLDLEWQADPVVDCTIEAESFSELLNAAKDYASDLAQQTGGRVKRVDLLNGHSVLGFIKIPI